MRVFAKKNLGFRNFETNEIVTTRTLEFATLPDWVQHDPMFNWAIQEGSLEVIEETPIIAGVNLESVVGEDVPNNEDTASKRRNGRRKTENNE